MEMYSKDKKMKILCTCQGTQSYINFVKCTRSNIQKFQPSVPQHTHSLTHTLHTSWRSFQFGSTVVSQLAARSVRQSSSWSGTWDQLVRRVADLTAERDTKSTSPRIPNEHTHIHSGMSGFVHLLLLLSRSPSCTWSRKAKNRTTAPFFHSSTSPVHSVGLGRTEQKLSLPSSFPHHHFLVYSFIYLFIVFFFYYNHQHRHLMTTTNVALFVFHSPLFWASNFSQSSPQQASSKSASLQFHRQRNRLIDWFSASNSSYPCVAKTTMASFDTKRDDCTEICFFTLSTGDVFISCANFVIEMWCRSWSTIER